MLRLSSAWRRTWGKLLPERLLQANEVVFALGTCCLTKPAEPLIWGLWLEVGDVAGSSTVNFQRKRTGTTLLSLPLSRRDEKLDTFTVPREAPKYLRIEREGRRPFPRENWLRAGDLARAGKPEPSRSCF
jgi:hypothetical protein